MPEFIREALDAEGLGEAYAARPAYQRDDYIGWIIRAQLADTREQRLAQMLEELRRGDVYMHAAWRPLRAALDDASAILGMRGRSQ